YAARDERSRFQYFRRASTDSAMIRSTYLWAPSIIRSARSPSQVRGCVPGKVWTGWVGAACTRSWAAIANPILCNTSRRVILGFSQGPLFVDRRIPVPQSLRVYCVSTCAAASPECGELITTGVEPRRCRLLEALCRIAHQVRKLRVPRRAERCDADVLVVGGEIRIKGDSTVNRDNSRQAPMSNRCIEPFVAGL